MMRNGGRRRRGHEQWDAVATATKLQDDQRASWHQLLHIDFEESLPLRAACRLRAQRIKPVHVCVCTNVKLSHLPVALPFIL